MVSGARWRTGSRTVSLSGRDDGPERRNRQRLRSRRVSHKNRKAHVQYLSCQKTHIGCTIDFSFRILLDERINKKNIYMYYAILIIVVI